MTVSNEIFSIYNAYLNNNLSHAYLVETNDLTNTFLDLKTLIKMLLCQEKFNDNCSKCNLCHLIDNNILPNFIVVTSDGKTIKKDAIDNLKSKLSMIPVYSKLNIYVILEPEKMNSVAYNKMLKFLEEPEENIIGFFVTENKKSVPSTIVSRCSIVKFLYEKDSNVLFGLDNEKYEYYNNYALEVYNYIENNIGDLSWYYSTVLSKELSKREDIIIIFKLLLKMYEDNIYKNKTKLNLIYKYLEMLDFNVNVNLMFDSFIIEMGDLNE